MGSPFYEFVGRLVVWAVMERYRRQIRAAVALGIVGTALGIGGYLALKHDVAEG